MATNRVQRGRKTQQIAAEYLHPVFPEAASIAASLPGDDILNTPGWSFEVKARRDFKPTEAIKQMNARVRKDASNWNACIMRPDGYGPERVGSWLVFMTFNEFRSLIGEYEMAMERDD